MQSNKRVISDITSLNSNNEPESPIPAHNSSLIAANSANFGEIKIGKLIHAGTIITVDAAKQLISSTSSASPSLAAINSNNQPLSLVNAKNVDLTKLSIDEYIVAQTVIKENTHLSEQDIKSKIWNLPLKNINFIGRKLLLDKLLHHLNATPHHALITACHGLGGVGKTQLAIEYAYQRYDDYQIIYLISADNTRQIEAAYLKLASLLGIASINQKAEEIIQNVITWLKSLKKCLLIFDNVNHYDEIKPYLPQLNCHVIITSRHAECGLPGIPVDIFTLDESRQYILKILNNRVIDSEQKIIHLANTMGHLPLALAQASAYIKKNNMDIEKYLELYSKNKSLFLSKSDLPVGDSHIPVFVTWDITMKTISASSTLAANLLTACAYLHWVNIPERFLMLFSEINLNNMQNEIYEEAISILSNYSMITMHENTISVHCLVQEVIRLKLDDKTKTSNTINQLIGIILKLISCDTSSNKNYEMPYFTHVLSLLSHAWHNRCYQMFLTLFINSSNYFRFSKDIIHIIGLVSNNNIINDMIKFITLNNKNDDTIKAITFISDIIGVYFYVGTYQACHDCGKYIDTLMKILPADLTTDSFNIFCLAKSYWMRSVSYRSMKDNIDSVREIEKGDYYVESKKEQLTSLGYYYCKALLNFNWSSSYFVIGGSHAIIAAENKMKVALDSFHILLKQMDDVVNHNNFITKVTDKFTILTYISRSKCYLAEIYLSKKDSLNLNIILSDLKACRTAYFPKNITEGKKLVHDRNMRCYLRYKFLLAKHSIFSSQVNSKCLQQIEKSLAVAKAFSYKDDEKIIVSLKNDYQQQKINAQPELYTLEL